MSIDPGLPTWHFLCLIPEIWHFWKWFGMENFVWHIRHNLAYFWMSQIIRAISEVRRNEHVANNILYSNLKILKIEELYFLEIAKFMY